MKTHIAIIALILSGSAAFAQMTPAMDPTIINQLLIERQAVQTDRAALKSLQTQLEIDLSNKDEIAATNDIVAISTAKEKLRSDFSTLLIDIKAAALANRNIERELKAQLKLARASNDSETIAALLALIEANKQSGHEIRTAFEI